MPGGDELVACLVCVPFVGIVLARHDLLKGPSQAKHVESQVGWHMCLPQSRSWLQGFSIRSSNIVVLWELWCNFIRWLRVVSLYTKPWGP